MIRGSVTPDREAIVSVEVLDTRGRSATIKAVVDTGFNGFMTLPSSVIQTLAVQLQGTRDATLADGSSLRLDIYRATVVWDGRPVVAQILAAEGGPLVGMQLMYGYELRVEVVDGGAVAITALP